MHKPILRSCFLAATFLLALPAFAQPAAVTSTLQAQRVEDLDGKTVRKPAEAAKPGDTVEYRGTYRNVASTPVAKLQATIPVPAGTTFVAGSTEPGAAQASTDGVRFAPLPLVRTIRLADGSSRQEPVPLAEYRFVRWDLGNLAAGRDAVVSLRVRIDAAQAVAARP
jgi:uncharacterized repeat protein (TIGR01451 family)